jgi:hypothetical protein
MLSMSPFVIHEYPKWAERTVRFARIASYGFCALTGLSAVFFTPNSLKAETYIIVGTMAVFGLICMVASITKRYVLEWVSLFFLTAGISTYVAAIWVSSIGNEKYVAGASIFTVLVLLMLIRVVDLTVFWLRNVRAAKLRLELPSDNS